MKQTTHLFSQILKSVTAWALMTACLFLFMPTGARCEADPAPVQDLSSQTAPETAVAEAPDSEPAEAPAPDDEALPVSILISAAGDCTLGGDAKSGDTRFARSAEKNGYDYFFSGVRDIFEADDLTIVNLEGPLTASTRKRGGRDFNFKGLPEYAQILSLGGVEAAGTANNHIRDFGNAGIRDTRAALKDAGITSFGMNETAVVTVKGIKIGLIGLTEWDYSTKQVTKRVKKLKKDCDLVIAAIHWGKELHYTATARQRKYAKAAVKGGADLVLGSHSHVVGGIEIMNGKYVVYSLGNFCFGGNSNPNDKYSMIFQQTFDIQPDGSVSPGEINVIPCTSSSRPDTNDYCPTPADDDTAEKILNKIDRLSRKFDSYPVLSSGTDEGNAA